MPNSNQGKYSQQSIMPQKLSRQLAVAKPGLLGIFKADANNATFNIPGS